MTEPINTTAGDTVPTQNPNETTPEAGTSTETPVFTEETLMAVLAYVGPLVLVPLFTKRDNATIMFHVQQGLVLFAIGAFLWVISRWFMLGFLWQIIGLLNFALLVLSLIGIYNALKNKLVPLPLVGKFSRYFKF